MKLKRYRRYEQIEKITEYVAEDIHNTSEEPVAIVAKAIAKEEFGIIDLTKLEIEKIELALEEKYNIIRCLWCGRYSFLQEMSENYNCMICEEAIKNETIGYNE